MSYYSNKYKELKRLYNDKKNSMFGKSYSGAGITLIEQFEGDTAVILFQTNRKGDIVYEDLGGGVDKSDNGNLATTAIREAYEESCGLINFFNSDHLNAKIDNMDMFVDNKVNDKYYRSYFIGVPSNLIDKMDYLNNKKVLNDNTINSVYNETVNIARFFIKDLIADGLLSTNNNFETSDTDGNRCTIFRRAVDIIRIGFTSGVIKLAADNPKKLIKLTSVVLSPQ